MGTLIRPACVDRAVSEAFDELAVDEQTQHTVGEVLAPLKRKHLPSYEHSLRVGLLARDVARVAGADERALLISGLVHDCGKADVAVSVLECSSGWTQLYQHLMEAHVVRGFRRLEGKLDFAAQVMVWHHKFQADPYPRHMPVPRVRFSEETLELARELGRLLAIADSYDALHRVNDKHGAVRALRGDEIRQMMLDGNKDQLSLLEQLYAEHVFEV